MPTKSLLAPEVRAFLVKAAGAELYAHHLYQHLSNQLQRLGRFGAAKFFQAESDNELAHYRRLRDYFNDRGDVAPVPAVEECDEIVTDLGDALQTAYDTELQLQRDYATWDAQCKDPITCQFLLFFLEEQRKSVGEFGDLLALLERAGGDHAALMMIDKQLGEA